MIQPHREFMLPCGEGKQSAVCFKTVHDESIGGELGGGDKRIAHRSRIDGQNALQPKSADRRRQNRWWAGLARNTGYWGVAFRCQSSQDRQLRSRRRENTAV